MTTETLPAIAPQLNGRAVALAEPANPLVMPVSPRFVADRYNAIQEIQREIFKEDVHFGTIPGTGPKKTLLKPGADALCTAFQLAPDFIKQPESVENADHIHLVYKCILTSPSGRVLASGIGSCNSKEEKYRWTTTARKCPKCGKETIAKSKEEWGGGWYCNAKKDGCGAKFTKGDRAIESQEAGRKENDNAWNFHNTITKMSQKRALVAATITACGISGEFTQDVEDFDLPNDKAKRGEATVEIRREDDGFGADVHPWPGSEDPRPSGEDADYRPVPPPVNEFGTDAPATQEAKTPPLWDTPPPPPNVSEDVAKAYVDIVKELAYCRTKDHFLRLKELMQSSGPAYLHASVTNLVNSRYRQLFPVQPKPDTKGA